MSKLPAFIRLAPRLFVTLALVLPAGYASAVVTEESGPLEPMVEHKSTTRNIVDALSQLHYVTAVIDDDLSSKIFDTYLSDLDPSKSYFLASDVEKFEPWRYELDNSLRRGDLNPAFEIFNVYHNRVINRFEQVVAGLEDGIDEYRFDVNETLELDREETPWAEDQAELDDLWRKRIKNSILNLRLAGKEDADIQELLLKRYKNRLNRTRQTISEDVYQLYMNSFTKTYDPHTQYFSPTTSENFNINMSLSLEGIGAVLQLEDEFTKVVSLVPAGPADKAGQLKPDDRILAVAQGEEGDLVDVIGWRLDEVVQLIRGKKDTVVKLQIVPAGENDIAKTRVIQITRNKVKLEEQSAKAEVIEVEQYGHTHKIGVIEIPTFYIDFRAMQAGDREYKSTTRDVRRLLGDLIAQGVEGVVVDLRDNGGGSLQEARTLTGLFIDRGPTVQIRSKSDRVDILNDRDYTTVYDGPMAVLVNRLSASASEIFAGAIQDYGRGLIIGSQTFGKGTVQSLRPLNRGQLKLTQAKFYRISGESTQHKGIIPDIQYPMNYDPESIGESTLNDPLPWDKIKAVGYRPKASIMPLLPELQNAHELRVAQDPEFSYLRAAFDYRRKRNADTEISLNEATRRFEKEAGDKFWVTLENKKRVAQGLLPINSLDELEEDTGPAVAEAGQNVGGVAPAEEGAENTEGELVGNEMAGVVEAPGADGEGGGTVTGEAKEEEEAPDAYIKEAGNILLDFISLQRQTAQQVNRDNTI